MDVYVETNFVLELALLQEQRPDCETLLRHAESGRLNLKVPAYCFIEPYETLIRRWKSRTRLASELSQEFSQLLRSEAFQKHSTALNQVTGFLIETVQEERSRMASTLQRLVSVAEVLPLEAAHLLSSLQYQARYGLAPQDALVFAAVTGRLSSSDAASNCFLNRNSKDFSDPDLVAFLKTMNCRIFHSFHRGVEWIQSQPP